jgi:hypothetical protein
VSEADRTILGKRSQKVVDIGRLDRERGREEKLSWQLGFSLYPNPNCPRHPASPKQIHVPINVIIARGHYTMSSDDAYSNKFKFNSIQSNYKNSIRK